MPDLTRFDFHVNRFMNSYSVDLMDACEVGQYLLLLCKAWQVGKDCCLPDDLVYLARHARVQTVSQRVLDKFPIVETEEGPMRRNEPLYEEWQQAIDRSNSGLARVAGRGGKWAETASQKTGMPVLFTGGNTAENTTVSCAVVPIPNQPIPTHTNPYQPTNTTGMCDLVPETKTNTLGSWKNIALRHKRVFGKQASVGQKNKYAEFCSHYGEDVVLACFDDWAPSAKYWVESANVNQPLFLFWKKLPEMAEVEKEISEEVQQEATTLAAEEFARKQNADAIEASVRQQMTEHAKFMEFKHPLRDAGEDPDEAMKG